MLWGIPDMLNRRSSSCLIPLIQINSLFNWRVLLKVISQISFLLLPLRCLELYQSRPTSIEISTHRVGVREIFLLGKGSGQGLRYSSIWMHNNFVWCCTPWSFLNYFLSSEWHIFCVGECILSWVRAALLVTVRLRMILNDLQLHECFGQHRIVAVGGGRTHI